MCAKTMNTCIETKIEYTEAINNTITEINDSNNGDTDTDTHTQTHRHRHRHTYTDTDTDTDTHTDTDTDTDTYYERERAFFWRITTDEEKEIQTQNKFSPNSMCQRR